MSDIRDYEDYMRRDADTQDDLLAENARLQKQHADAITLLRWASDCWQDGGELRPDFDDCVDAIRGFLAALATAQEEGRG